MNKISPVLRSAEDAVGGKYLMFRCPGCLDAHTLRVSGGNPTWGWNESAGKPTFTPSVLVTGFIMSDEGYDMLERGEKPVSGQYPGHEMCCHSFVTDGRIQFLSDCTHALAGQTVDLLEWGDV